MRRICVLLSWQRSVAFLAARRSPVLRLSPSVSTFRPPITTLGKSRPALADLARNGSPEDRIPAPASPTSGPRYSRDSAGRCSLKNPAPTPPASQATALACAPLRRRADAESSPTQSVNSPGPSSSTAATSSLSPREPWLISKGSRSSSTASPPPLPDSSRLPHNRHSRINGGHSPPAIKGR